MKTIDEMTPDEKHAELKEAIRSTINGSQGVNSVAFVLLIMGRYHPKEVNIEEVSLLIDELVKEEAIIEVEYFLPQMAYRTKSLYFPKGTTFNVRDGKKNEPKEQVGPDTTIRGV